MNTRLDAEMPLYFGAQNELFGLFHAAAAPTRKAVLLCPPLGQDQIRCHRLYRQLAQALVAERIAVLRFDYFGTGDSAGNSAEVDWERCRADTVTAARELRMRSGADRIVAFGARLGGSIALASSASAGFDGIIAWDPILNGDDYVQRLDALQEQVRVDRERFVVPRREEEVASQWLGFAVSERLRQQLIAWHVEPANVPTLVLDSLEPSQPRSWQRVVSDQAMVRSLQPSTSWEDLRRLELAILSHPLIQTVTDHMREAA